MYSNERPHINHFCPGVSDFDADHGMRMLDAHGVKGSIRIRGEVEEPYFPDPFMARIDRSKRALGGAIKRTEPSRAATLLVQRKLVTGRVLDYGCGYGVDAATYSWEAFDPYYRPVTPAPPYDTIVCISVLNALSRNNRLKLTNRIQELLADDGRAYLCVPRDLPQKGKLGMNHSLQNYVLLTLPSIYADEELEIYELTRTAAFDDKTVDYVSRRDQRKDR